MTTIKMLRLLDGTNQFNIAIYHLDGTYRITINNFPLSVFGRTDMNRKFFPIAIAMLSSEKNEMIVAFFIALQNSARFFGINVNCHFIMIDTAPEEALAIRKAWPLAIILMCWFHVKKNIKEPKHAGHPNLKPIYDDILSAINYIHYSTTVQDFEARKEEVLSKWSACVYEPRIYLQLQKFKQYFIDQWLTGSFNNWQIFNTPAGYSTTQNPEESFNGQIKDVFTEFERLTVLGACESMRKICLHYSENQPVFKLVKDKCNATIKLAKECLRTDFVQTDPNTLWYKNKYQIILEPRFCSCAYFIDEVTCKHHVGACIITNHVDYSDREFVIAKGKGRPKKNAKGAQTF